MQRIDPLLLESPPKGLRVEHTAEGISISHWRSGMGCMNFFLIFWLAGWTAACAAMISPVLKGEIPLWVAALFWLADVGVGSLIVYMLFSHRVYRLSKDRLEFETRLFSFVWTKVFEVKDIRRFEQVVDGGQGDDSFPSWGLKLRGTKDQTLIFRQPIETSTWLGKALSEWFGVEFVRYRT